MGCGEMKRRGNRAAKGGMEMEIYMGNQKRGRKIKRKLLSIGALLLALPVYGISNGFSWQCAGMIGIRCCKGKG